MLERPEGAPLTEFASGELPPTVGTALTLCNRKTGKTQHVCIYRHRKITVFRVVRESKEFRGLLVVTTCTIKSISSESFFARARMQIIGRYTCRVGMTRFR